MGHCATTTLTDEDSTDPGGADRLRSVRRRPFEDGAHAAGSVEFLVVRVVVAHGHLRSGVNGRTVWTSAIGSLLGTEIGYARARIHSGSKIGFSAASSSHPGAAGRGATAGRFGTLTTGGDWPDESRGICVVGAAGLVVGTWPDFAQVLQQ